MSATQITEVHIASVVLQTLPTERAEAMAVLRDHGAADIQVLANGKIVAVLECGHERELARCVDELQSMRGVMSVSLVTHFIENTTDLLQEHA